MGEQQDGGTVEYAVRCAHGDRFCDPDTYVDKNEALDAAATADHESVCSVDHPHTLVSRSVSAWVEEMP